MCLTCGCQRPNDDHGARPNITIDDLQAAADWCGITVKQAAQNIFNTLDVDVYDPDAGLDIKTVADSNGYEASAATYLPPGPTTLDGSTVLRGSQEAVLGPLLRENKEKQYTLAVAWGLDPDKRPAADGHRVVISPDALERTAWEFMQTRSVGLYHQDGTEGHGHVVESYIYRGPNWKLQDAYGKEVLVRAGFWLVGIKWDDKAWSLIKRGYVNGLSPQGVATFKKVKEQA